MAAAGKLQRAQMAPGGRIGHSGLKNDMRLSTSVKG